MPGWHEAAKQWVADGRVVLLGITQEQHAERCQLFAQWHQIDWPILHDPINLMKSRAVPIVVAIDEHGIVRSTRPRVTSLEAEFLDKTFPAPTKAAPTSPRTDGGPDIQDLRSRALADNSAGKWRRYADELALWHNDDQLGEAIAAYTNAYRLDQEDGDSRFRLGVCLRRRYESPHRQPRDFQTAVDSWSAALAIDPNQYIWRRRIQQYGPRLDKPYPFYDWVEQANREITARGETPIELPVLPRGAELAQPLRAFTAANDGDKSPDPDGKIQRDDGLILAEVAIVPATIKPGQSARVHVTLRPAGNKTAHWNNEVEPLKLWIDTPDGWVADRKLLTAPPPETAESSEPRHLEFEIKAPRNAAGDVTIAAYALYYVCEEVGGQCLFQRLDLSLKLKVKQ